MFHLVLQLLQPSTTYLAFWPDITEMASITVTLNKSSPCSSSCYGRVEFICKEGETRVEVKIERTTFCDNNKFSAEI